jgi:hypothetical protein
MYVCCSCGVLFCLVSVVDDGGSCGWVSSFFFFFVSSWLTLCYVVVVLYFLYNAYTRKHAQATAWTPVHAIVIQACLDHKLVKVKVFLFLLLLRLLFFFFF